MPEPEKQAREQIDKLFTAVGWIVSDPAAANLSAGRGVAIRKFPLKSVHGFANYLRHVDRKNTDVIEAKKSGSTLIGVETQYVKYAADLSDDLSVWFNPLDQRHRPGTPPRFKFSNEGARESKEKAAKHFAL